MPTAQAFQSDALKLVGPDEEIAKCPPVVEEDYRGRFFFPMTAAADMFFLRFKIASQRAREKACSGAPRLGQPGRLPAVSRAVVCPENFLFGLWTIQPWRSSEGPKSLSGKAIKWTMKAFAGAPVTVVNNGELVNF